MGHEPWMLENQESSANNGLPPVEPRDAERVGFGGIGNEPWAIDGSGDNIENPSDEETGPPEGGAEEGPPEGGVEEGPSDVEGSVEVPQHIIETIPTVPSQALMLEAGASLRNPVDAAIQAMARVREDRERLFGRAAPRVERLNQSRGNLEAIYANYMIEWANLLADYSSVSSSIEETKNGFQSEIGIRQEEIIRLQESDLPEEVKNLQIREQQIQIDIHRAAIQECDNRLQELRNTKEKVLTQVETQMKLEMGETRLDIESAQAEQNAGSLVGKFKNMWRRHPVARIAIGAGLAATGFLVGGPIGGVAMVAGVGMRGFGGYMGTEGGVNKFRDWRADKTSAQEAEAANSRTSLAARAQGERYVGNALIEGVRGDRLAAQNEFMQRHAQELYGEQMLRQVLNGDSAAAGEVATILLKDQLDRAVEDSRWKRGAKLGGAVVGTALAALGLLRHFDADKPGPPKTPTEPRPPSSPPEGYDPRIPRMAAIHEIDPNTPENWQNLHEYAAANPAAAAAEAVNQAALDRAYEAASAGMPRPQLDQLNRIIAIGAETVGNEQMTKIIEPLASNVRSGMPTEKILELYGLPKPIR